MHRNEYYNLALTCGKAWQSIEKNDRVDATLRITEAIAAISGLHPLAERLATALTLVNDGKSAQNILSEIQMKCATIPTLGGGGAYNIPQGQLLVDCWKINHHSGTPEARKLARKYQINVAQYRKIRSGQAKAYAVFKDSHEYAPDAVVVN